MRIDFVGGTTWSPFILSMELGKALNFVGGDHCPSQYSGATEFRGLFPSYR
jgi:hypothetical protein